MTEQQEAQIALDVHIAHLRANRNKRLGLIQRYYPFLWTILPIMIAIIAIFCILIGLPEAANAIRMVTP